MKKFKVLADSISWIGAKAFKKNNIVTENDYPNHEELVRRGFLELVKEVEETEKPIEIPKKTTPKRKTTK
jgi:hypothetical protein